MSPICLPGSWAGVPLPPPTETTGFRPGRVQGGQGTGIPGAAGDMVLIGYVGTAPGVTFLRR